MAIEINKAARAILISAKLRESEDAGYQFSQSDLDLAEDLIELATVDTERAIYQSIADRIVSNIQAAKDNTR